MIKPKTKKILTIIGIVLLSIVLVCEIGVYFLFIHHYKGHVRAYNWDASDEFNINSIATVNKQVDKDFVILNLADVQMADLDDFWHMNVIHNEITYLVNTVKPDLITLTGDQTWSNENLISLKSLIRWLDRYKIPWAPVFGNHDYGNTKDSAVLSQNACCDLYEKSKYCLFDRGPTNLGALGNYVVNIMEGDKIYKTLYMIDAGFYDTITDKQIEWMQWNAEGIKVANGGEYVPAMCFMHKPLPEYATAYHHYIYGYEDVQVIGDVHVHNSLSGTQQNGFFDMAKSVGVTDIVCGHQHGNNFTIRYQDVRLTFALKSSELVGYWGDDEVYLNGGTKFVLSGDSVEINNIFVPRGPYHIKGSDNQSKD